MKRGFFTDIDWNIIAVWFLIEGIVQNHAENECEGKFSVVLVRPFWIKENKSSQSFILPRFFLYFLNIGGKFKIHKIGGSMEIRSEKIHVSLSF